MMGDDAFETLLDYLKAARSFDFTGYKRASLKRRVDKRLHAVSVDSYEDYKDYLEVHPEEFAILFDTILINVTSFFRDAPMWDHLATEIVPQTAERLGDGAFRIWSAGCASGEEAYTIAIVVAEALGESTLRDRVKIFATDIDEDALTHARHGEYDASAISPVPVPIRERYFEQLGDRYAFRKDLRRSVIFGRNDLMQDAPISRVDLLVCRNTLMYFHAGTQGEVLRHFHFALNDHGYLFLGKSEMLTRHAELFRPMHSRMRAFEKLAGGTVRARPPAELPARPDEMGSNAALREAALDAGLVAQVVVDAAGQLVLANYEARRLFGIAMADLGQRLQDVELSYRPVELRSLIEKALAERHAVRVNDVEWEVAGREPRRLSLQLRPLPVADGAVGGVAITFSDVTSIYQLNSQLERSRHDRDTADEELQSTVEELETTNEELQSTNEELETTNEELQSTNEELETMNEELQSINAELETVNDELRLRTTELNSANSYLEGILGSLRLGVIAVDRDRMVNIWNRETEELWGLRADEVAGKDLMSLDIGFPLDRLRAPLTACMAGGEADHPVLTVPAVNRRGRKIGVRVTLTPLQNDGQLSGVIVVMESIGPGGELLEHDGV